MATITNQVAASALRGQGVKITVSTAERAKFLALTIGTTCTAQSSSNTGTIASIDTLGNSFIINPTSPAGNFSGSTSLPSAGHFDVLATITY